jgi:hypothetical protein
MYITFVCDIMSRMILSTQNSNEMVLEDLLLSTKQSHAASIKMIKIYGVLKTKVLWGVTLCRCVSIL